MDYHLSSAEMETIIRWDRESDTATIYTCDSVTMTKIRRCAEAEGSEWKKKSEEKFNGRVIAETWEAPKSLITFRTKTFHREMTEEQKAIAAERMKKINSRRISGAR